MSHCGHTGRKNPPPSKWYYQTMLPKVGDKLIRRMSVGNSGVGLDKIRPDKVTVTFVNREHLWYEVQFSCGVRQAFKIV